jgi:hypothetical protein
MQALNMGSMNLPETFCQLKHEQPPALQLHLRMLSLAQALHGMYN